MFDGFETTEVDAGAGPIHVRRAGSGPPLLLMHGYPQTHAIWHPIAPALAEDFTVVLTDLRGYGASAKPETTPDHWPLCFPRSVCRSPQIHPAINAHHNRNCRKGHKFSG